jgi:formate-dependent nitrite reductase membrane component NrfD
MAWYWWLIIGVVGYAVLLMLILAFNYSAHRNDELLDKSEGDNNERIQ